MSDLLSEQIADRVDPKAELRDVALRAGRGDAAALSMLVRATSRTVWRACAALVDPASADDLTQETYLRAVRSLPSYRGDSAPARWLLTIARRVCAEEIKSRQSHRATLAAVRAQRLPHAVDPMSNSDVADALAGLSPERREAFLLAAVAGFSYAEVAEMCGCPIGTVRSRVARARSDLIAALAPVELEEAVS
jgi:RNA polymerase sigma-70 factor (ECF subfamily)